MAAEAEAVRRIAGQVAAALGAADLAAYSDLLDPAVTWGSPGHPEWGCQRRAQVLAWYGRGREAGTRATVTETAVSGDKILVGLKVTGRLSEDGSPVGDEDRWQILTVRNGRVTDIVGFGDRDEAVSWGGLQL
jgi:ketosteroid isomerase-like protein